jgi:BioD-like phosphotransacetylase family protein
MEKWVVASLHRSDGKTSAIVGISAALNRKIGYLKPFGDRVVYHEKRLWDHDAALIGDLFALREDPADMSIGLDHSKLRYAYDEAGIKQKLLEAVARTGRDKEILFIEGGPELSYGSSVHLDPISLAKYTGSKLLILMAGGEDSVLDDTVHLKKRLDLAGVNLGGIIINRVLECDRFQRIQQPAIRDLGLRVIGIIPYRSELSCFSVGNLASSLFARVITGEGGLHNIVKNILIGAWSAHVFMQDPIFKKSHKLIITGGDRADMILASLESDTSGIILTNNILPPSNIICKAAERNIPLLMVSSDSFQTARQIERLEPLLNREDAEKVELLKQLFTKHGKVDEVFTG